MAGQVVPMRVGDVEVLVQTIAVPGTEQTSKFGERALDMFEQAQDVILGAARSTVELIARMGSEAKPDMVEVEFGLGFSAKGNVVVAAGSVDATIKVKLVYQ